MGVGILALSLRLVAPVWVEVVIVAAGRLQCFKRKVHVCTLAKTEMQSPLLGLTIAAFWGIAAAGIVGDDAFRGIGKTPFAAT